MLEILVGAGTGRELPQFQEDALDNVIRLCSVRGSTPTVRQGARIAPGQSPDTPPNPQIELRPALNPRPCQTPRRTQDSERLHDTYTASRSHSDDTNSIPPDIWTPNCLATGAERIENVNRTYRPLHFAGWAAI